MTRADSDKPGQTPARPAADLDRDAAAQAGAAAVPGMPQPEAGRKAPSTWHARPVLLLLLCGFLIAAAIVATTSLLLSSLREQALVDKERELQNTALVLAAHLDGMFGAVTGIQANLIDQIGQRRFDSPEAFDTAMSGLDVNAMLREKLAGLPHVGSILLVNAKGRLINWSRPWPVPWLEAADREYFQLLTSDDTPTVQATELVRNRGNGAWAIQIARKITGSDGRFLGVMLGSLELPVIERFFESISLGDGGVVSLARQDGRLLARHPAAPASIDISLASNPVFRDVLSNANTGVARIKSLIDGEERVMAGRRLANYPAIVTVGVTVEGALLAWRNGAFYLVSAAILLVVVIGGTVFLSTWQVQSNLRDQNLRLDAALTNMSQGLCMFDAEQRLVVCNDRYARLYGLSPDQVKPGMSLRQIMALRLSANPYAGHDPAPYMRQIVDERIVEATGKAGPSEPAEGFATTVTPHSQHMRRLRNGHIIAVTNQPLPGGGWVATHEDITEARRREASLQLMFKSNPIPMWVYGVASLRFLAVNDAAIAHYGYSREQFLAMSVLDIAPQRDHESLTRAVYEPRPEQDGKTVWRHIKADGSEIDVLVYARALVGSPGTELEFAL